MLGRSTVARGDQQSRAVLVEVPYSGYREETTGESDARVSRVTRQRRIATSLLLLDTTAILVATSLASLTHPGAADAASWSAPAGSTPPYLLVAVMMTLTILAYMGRAHLYNIDSIGWGSGEYRKSAGAVLLGVMTTIAVLFLLGMASPSPQWTTAIAIYALTLVVLWRALGRLARSRMLRRGGWLPRPTLIVGSNMEAAEVARLLKANPDCGLVPVGCLRSSQKDRLSFDYCSPSLPTLGIARALPEVVRQQCIDTVIIVASAFDYDVVQRMISELRGLSVNVHISSALSEVLCSRVLIQDVGGIPVISLKGVSLSPMQLHAKRAFDIAVAGTIVVLGMPLWATLAFLIKTTSEGPVFFKQLRIGRDGEPFMMYKFRSMVADAEDRLRELQDANEADGPLFKIHDDPRITWVGRWMRKLSLDEFPQLLNVLRGEMSLVGPRPPLPKETVCYTSDDWRRLEVPPGMTGLWQVSGRSNLTFHDMVRLDVFYIDNWSLSLDISLLARTPGAVVSTRGAC